VAQIDSARKRASQFSQALCVMNNTVSEKEGLEQGAITNFAEYFSANSNRGHLMFKESLQPPYPDTLCELTGQPLYVEVAHIYGTETDAKYLLRRTGRAQPTKQERLKSTLTPLDKRYLIPLNKVLKSKAEKIYKGKPVWLLVRNGLPLWTSEDFNEHINEIKIPKKHPFDEIWLLCAPSGQFGAIQLYGNA